jgi:uncharacterized protein (DUF58 family)
VTVRATAPPRTTRLPAARDGRLLPYAVLGLGGLGGAFLGGEPALAVLSMPFLAALALGLRALGAQEVAVSFELDEDQVMEGDEVAGRIVVAWDGRLHGQLMLHRLTGVEPKGADPLSWPLMDESGRAEVTVSLRATRWGRHPVAEAWVQLRAPFGLLAWTGAVHPGPILRVLPGTERLDRLLDPADSRAVWGAHRSRRIGDGHEFAEIRPYQPGDRLRDLNWTATARHGRPFVNRHHPDLAGDVVIALDLFDDGSAAGRAGVLRAARVAWALASVHLRANDRVGLTSLGGSTRWLPPRGGRRARYALLDTLLRIGGDAAGAPPLGAAGRSPPAPPSALVIVLTALQDPETVRAVSAWRARGQAVAVVRIDAGDGADATGTPAEALARRIVRLEVHSRERALARLGAPIVAMAPGEPVTHVVAALRRARRAPAVRGAGP